MACRKNLKTDPVIMKSYHVFVDGEGSESVQIV